MTDENKSEKASEYKLREARKRGQVSKSMELNTWLLLFVGIIYLYLFSDDIGSRLMGEIRRYFQVLSSIKSDSSLLTVSSDFFVSLSFILMPFLLILVVASIMINLFSIGFIFSFEPLKPKFEKMDPMKGLKKIFSKKNLFELFKQIIKLILVSICCYVMFSGSLDRLISISQDFTQSSLGNALSKETLRVGFYVLAATLPLVLVDVLFTNWDFRKQMMMSPREVKEEYKKKEGDPQVKSKRKETQRELSQKLGALGKVKGADVVINNPIHIAVALKFDPDTMISPLLVASGRGVLGKSIRQLAVKHGVLQITNIPLARSLYNQVDIGHPVPQEYFKELAPIFRKILGMESAQ